MQRALRFWALTAAAVFAASAVALSASGAERTKRAPRESTRPAAGARSTTKATVELFAVIMVGEEYEVLRQAEVADRRKQAAEEYKREKKDYDEARKEKDKTKQPPPKPVQKKVVLLKQGFKSQEAAEEYKQKRQEQKQTGPAKKTAALPGGVTP